MSTIVPRSDDTSEGVFDVLGINLRFGVTDDDRIYVIASDFAKAVGYRDAANATRLLDEDEKGTQIVSTSSVTSVNQFREMTVIYEDGIWELIFRSSLPGAKTIKKRVKAILREIRQTGRYEADKRAVGLEEKANTWDILASGNGDYSLRTAAHILNRDPDISIGQNNLHKLLIGMRMFDRNGEIYARYKRYLVRRARGAYWNETLGATVNGGSQVRVTAHGLKYLHKRLGGTDTKTLTEVHAA